MSKETFREKSRTPNWDRMVNLPDGGKGKFIAFERDIEHTFGKDKHNYGMVIDLKPLEAYALIQIEPFSNEVKIPLEQFFEVN